MIFSNLGQYSEGLNYFGRLTCVWGHCHLWEIERQTEIHFDTLIDIFLHDFAIHLFLNCMYYCRLFSRYQKMKGVLLKIEHSQAF